MKSARIRKFSGPYIRTKYRDLLCKSEIYSVQMRENPDQKNTEYGHFLRSENTVDVKNPFRKKIWEKDRFYFVTKT